MFSPLSGKATYSETENELTVKAKNHTFIFSKRDGQPKGVSVNNHKTSFANGPRFIGARRADRSLINFTITMTKRQKKKDRTYSEFPDAAVFYQTRGKKKTEET